jgi:hypothetical protein
MGSFSQGYLQKIRNLFGTYNHNKGCCFQGTKHTKNTSTPVFLNFLETWWLLVFLRTLFARAGGKQQSAYYMPSTHNKGAVLLENRHR